MQEPCRDPKTIALYSWYQLGQAFEHDKTYDAYRSPYQLQDELFEWYAAALWWRDGGDIGKTLQATQAMQHEDFENLFPPRRANQFPQGDAETTERWWRIWFNRVMSLLEEIVRRGPMQQDMIAWYIHWLRLTPGEG